VDSIRGDVGLAFMASGIFLFALIILFVLESAYYITNSPPHLPIIVGVGLFSFGTLTMGGGSSKLKEISAESKVGRTFVLLLSYVAVPICVFLLLLSAANLHAVYLYNHPYATDSYPWGFPATYVEGCLAVLVTGPIGPCYGIVWDGFWIDALFYTAWGYGFIILASLIPRVKPPGMALPGLEDIANTLKRVEISYATQKRRGNFVLSIKMFHNSRRESLG